MRMTSRLPYKILTACRSAFFIIFKTMKKFIHNFNKEVDHKILRRIEYTLKDDIKRHYAIEDRMERTANSHAQSYSPKLFNMDKWIREKRKAFSGFDEERHRQIANRELDLIIRLSENESLVEAAKKLLKERKEMIAAAKGLEKLKLMFKYW